ncbi:hypothetical protein [Allostreptomyces psammosilenae]|uniref:Uncharacterized protein n=1 Tax=Allostreptomyces psammosilenae TaxID=1892865 RepID=A0A852ZT80_9ACTN|nr:hypothetical protein [Allostreptomyces psammosilenae]NYI05045.1 hypothetical protein [Allostreptomyces psammosilenae]
MVDRDTMEHMSVEQARVFQAVSRLETEFGPGRLTDVARTACLPPERVRQVVQELDERFGLVIEAPAANGGEPRYHVVPED